MLYAPFCARRCQNAQRVKDIIAHRFPKGNTNPAYFRRILRIAAIHFAAQDDGAENRFFVRKGEKPPGWMKISPKACSRHAQCPKKIFLHCAEKKGQKYTDTTKNERKRFRVCAEVHFP